MTYASEINLYNASASKYFLTFPAWSISKVIGERYETIH